MRKYELVAIQKNYSYTGTVNLGDVMPPPNIYWTLTFQYEDKVCSATENLIFHSNNKTHINRFIFGHEYMVHEIASSLEL